MPLAVQLRPCYVGGVTDSFSDCIGRETTRQDTIAARLVAQWRATLAPFLFEAHNAAPPCIHWCVAPALPAQRDLGPDGAEARGVFLPPIPLPRRMWAGGLIEFFAPIEIGSDLTRRSVISDIKWREGRGGELCLVSVSHELTDARQLLLRERQDLVFRESAPPKPKAIAPDVAARLTWTVDLNSTLLFRFSALTFNAHRIHFDHPYAVDVEGYSGLVVHGPLQAALLLNQAACLLGAVPRRFEYRCVAPLIAGQHAKVESWNTADAVSGRIRTAEGVATIEATATP